MTCGCSGRKSSYDPVAESGCCFGSSKHHRRPKRKCGKCCCPVLDAGCPPIATFWSTGVSGKTNRPLWYSTGVYDTYCQPGPYTNFQTSVTGFSGNTSQR